MSFRLFTIFVVFIGSPKCKHYIIGAIFFLVKLLVYVSYYKLIYLDTIFLLDFYQK